MRWLAVLTALSIVGCAMEARQRDKRTFSECMLRAVETRKPLTPEARARLAHAMAAKVDLTVLVREVDEEYSSDELTEDLRSCARHAGKLQFGAYSQTLQLQNIQSGTLRDLARELPPAAEAQAVVFAVRKAGTPLAGAKLTLRADGSRVRNRACWDARTLPLTTAELWAGSADPCLEAVADQSGSAEFFSDAPITRYKLSVFDAAAQRDSIHYAPPGRPVPPRVELDVGDTDASAWEHLPSEALPSCGEARAVTKLIAALAPDALAGLKGASVLVDDQGHLRDPHGVSKSAWVALRYVRVDPPKLCKPGRVALPSPPE